MYLILMGGWTSEAAALCCLLLGRPLMDWALTDCEQYLKRGLMLCSESLLSSPNWLPKLHLPNKQFGGGDEERQLQTLKNMGLSSHIWNEISCTRLMSSDWLNLILLFHDFGMQNFQLIISKVWVKRVLTLTVFEMQYLAVIHVWMNLALLNMLGFNKVPSYTGLVLTKVNWTYFSSDLSDRMFWCIKLAKCVADLI